MTEKFKEHFYGKIQAQSILWESSISNCFLLRSSGTQYWLSVKRENHGCKHFEIIIASSNCKIEGKEKMFESVSALLQFYQQSPISNEIDSIGVEIINNGGKKASGSVTPLPNINGHHSDEHHHRDLDVSKHGNPTIFKSKSEVCALFGRHA